MGQLSSQQKQASESRQTVEAGLSYVKNIASRDVPGETDLRMPQAERDAIVRRFIDALDIPPFVSLDSKSFREIVVFYSPGFEVSNTSRARMTMEHKIEPAEIGSALKGLIIHSTSDAAIDTTAKLSSLPPTESQVTPKREVDSWLLLCPDCPVDYDVSSTASARKASSYMTEIIPAGALNEELASANKFIDRFGIRVSSTKQTRAIRVRIYYQ